MTNKNKNILLGGAALLLLYSLNRSTGAPVSSVPWSDIVDTLATHPIDTYTNRSLSQINKIIVHHFASDGTPQAVANYHVNHNGWPGIGYHIVIAKDGSAYLVNRFETLSYHVSGQNTNSLGIALEGNFENETPTAAQLNKLDKVIAYIRYLLPQNLPVYQHSDFASHKPYDASLNLSKYSLNGLSGYRCQDGTITTNNGPGGCSHHGGYFDELKYISESDLETLFYKEYNLALHLINNKISPESWNRYGDSNLSKEKFMWLKKGGIKLDDESQVLTNYLGIEIEPQDFVNIVLDYNNPYSYINDLKAEVLQMYKAQGIINEI